MLAAQNIHSHRCIFASSTRGHTDTIVAEACYVLCYTQVHGASRHMHMAVLYGRVWRARETISDKDSVIFISRSDPSLVLENVTSSSRPADRSIRHVHVIIRIEIRPYIFTLFPLRKKAAVSRPNLLFSAHRFRIHHTTSRRPQRRGFMLPFFIIFILVVVVVYGSILYFHRPET